MNGPSQVRVLLLRYPELAAVMVAAAIGLLVQPPLAWLAGRHAIDVLLAILVFATAVTIEPAALRRLARSWRPVLGAVAAGAAVLPALAWAASRAVTAGPLRNGIMTVGLAPCEIASVATTAMAGGEAAVAAGVLVGSTLATVALAGPLLALEAGDASLHPARIVAQLALVVLLPLVAGLALRARRVPGPRFQRVAVTTVTTSVAALVAVIAAEVHLSGRYVAVTAALAGFLAGSALLGWLLAGVVGRPTAAALLLTTSMRDFAIAAGIAAAAFGPDAAAPLGVYGIVVLAWGTGVAGALRHRAGGPPAPSTS